MTPHLRRHVSGKRTHARPYTVDIPERRYAHRDVHIRSKRPPDGEKGNRRAPEIPWPTAKHPTTKKPSGLNCIHSIQGLTYLSLIFFSCLYVPFALTLSPLPSRLASPRLALKFHLLTVFLPLLRSPLTGPFRLSP